MCLCGWYDLTRVTHTNLLLPLTRLEIHKEFLGFFRNSYSLRLVPCQGKPQTIHVTSQMATAPLPTSRTESTIPPYLSKRSRRKFQELEKKGLFGGFCTFPDNPTPQIILLNCSLSNGLGRQAVYSILQPANPLQVLMPPTSDYSIVTLASTEQAVEVKERCDGKAVLDLLSSQQQSQLLCRTFLSGPKVAVHVVYVRFEAGPPGTLISRHSLPNGLSVVEGIITKDEELNLLHLFSSEGHSERFDEEQEKESLKLRRVEHFGYKFEYGSNNVDPNMPLSTPIPNLLCIILKRVLEQKVISCFPDQLTVNEYKPGQGQSL